MKIEPKDPKLVKKEALDRSMEAFRNARIKGYDAEGAFVEAARVYRLELQRWEQRRKLV